MTSATTHPLVASWVRDLELLLHGIEPGERAEVLAGVQEHLDASLPPGSTDADVRTVLTELGSPQSVADEAYAGRPPVSLSAHPPRTRPGTMSRGWVPVAVGLTLGLALVLVTLTSALSAGYSVTSSSSGDSAGTVIESADQVSYNAAFPGGAFWALIILSWLWVVPLFLCLASPLWSGKDKTAVALTLPIAATLVTALPDLGWAVSHTTWGINVGAWSGLALAFFGGGYIIVRTWRLGSLRAQDLANGGAR